MITHWRIQGGFFGFLRTPLTELAINLLVKLHRCYCVLLGFKFAIAVITYESSLTNKLGMPIGSVGFPCCKLIQQIKYHKPCATSLYIIAVLISIANHGCGSRD